MINNSTSSSVWCDDNDDDQQDKVYVDCVVQAPEAQADCGLYTVISAVISCTHHCHRHNQCPLHSDCAICRPDSSFWRLRVQGVVVMIIAFVEESHKHFLLLLEFWQAHFFLVWNQFLLEVALDYNASWTGPWCEKAFRKWSSFKIWRGTHVGIDFTD